MQLWRLLRTTQYRKWFNCDHRFGKYSLYALTTGIVFEYDLKMGEGLVPV